MREKAEKSIKARKPLRRAVFLAYRDGLRTYLLSPLTPEQRKNVEEELRLVDFILSGD
jgi:hypothetical protein